MNREKLWGNLLYYAGAALSIVLLLSPVFWELSSSLQTTGSLLATHPAWVPVHPYWGNYRSLLAGQGASQGFGYGLANCTVVGLVTTGITLVIGLMAAYAFARLRFRLRRTLLYTILGTQMVPGIVVVIPLFVLFQGFHLLDTRVGLVLAYLTFTVPFAVWILTGFVASIPIEVDEAARIDGCSVFGVLRHVTFPLAVPALIGTGILTFLTVWDEFLFAVTFQQTVHEKTLPVILAGFIGKFEVQYGLLAAGGILAIVPPLVLALVFQRYVTRGLTAGSTVG